MKTMISAAIVAVTLVFGTMPASAQDSRAARIMTLFTAYCVPDFSHLLQATIRSNLEKVARPTGDGPFWFDDASGAFLYVDRTRCTITTPREDPLNREDGAELTEMIDRFVPGQFPELEFEPSSTWGAPDLATVWMKGTVGSWDRWGVFSFVVLEAGADQGSDLAYVRPPNER